MKSTTRSRKRSGKKSARKKPVQGERIIEDREKEKEPGIYPQPYDLHAIYSKVELKKLKKHPAGLIVIKCPYCDHVSETFLRSLKGETFSYRYTIPCHCKAVFDVVMRVIEDEEYYGARAPEKPEGA